MLLPITSIIVQLRHNGGGGGQPFPPPAGLRYSEVPSAPDFSREPLREAPHWPRTGW